MWLQGRALTQPKQGSEFKAPNASEKRMYLDMDRLEPALYPVDQPNFGVAFFFF